MHLFLTLTVILSIVSLGFGLRSRMVAVRVARTVKDYEAIINYKFQFLERSSPSPHEIAYVKKWMETENTMCLIAETVDGGEFAGSLEMRPLDESFTHFSLQNIVVNPKLRRIGVATTLIHTVDQFLMGKLGDYPISPWKKGSSEVVAQYHYSWMTHFKGLPPKVTLELHVHPENVPAIALYEKAGYSMQRVARLPFTSAKICKMTKHVVNVSQTRNANPSTASTFPARQDFSKLIQLFM